VLEDNYKAGDKSFTADHQAEGIVAEARRSTWLPSRTTSGLSSQMRRRSHVSHCGGDGYDTPLLLSVGGKAANNVYFSTHAYMAEDSTPAIVAFYKAYKAAYNTPPENAFAALGYDTVGLVADAITRAGSVDPAKIRDALAATQGYKGITGSISYAPDSRVPQKTVSIIGVKDDKLFLADEVTPNWIPKP
jgi:branched-chain amino acid transport system substrate-binding protein